MSIEKKDRPIFSEQSVQGARGDSLERPVTVIINNNSSNNLTRRRFLRLAALTLISGGAGATAGIAIKDKLSPEDARVPILENSLQTAQDTIGKLQKQIENLENQRDKKQSELASTQAENRQLSQEKKEAEIRLSQAESEAQRERNKAQEATARTTKLEKEKEQLLQENSKLSLENRTLRETLDLVTFKYQEIIRKIFAKSPVDELLLPVLGVMEISANLSKNINAEFKSKAKKTHDDIEKTFIVFNFFRQSEKISDLTFAAFGSLYESVVYPVAKKLREVADWLEEKNSLSQKFLEMVEKSNWEPLKALLNVRNKFLAFYQFFLEKMPNQIEERRQLRNQKIEQIEKELENNPPAILEFLDKTTDFFDRITKVWANRENLIKFLREWVQDLREAEQKSKELTESYKGGSGGSPTLY